MYFLFAGDWFVLYEFGARSNEKKVRYPFFWNVEGLLSLFNNVIIFILNIDCVQRSMIKTEFLSS